MACQLLLFVCLSAATTPGTAAPAEKPNLLLIFVDDMGYADPGCYGGTLAPTPNIDALAAGGVRCTDGYVTSPVCAPSRCGLMTGAYGQRFGMQWNEDQYRNRAYQIPDEHKLLPQALAAGGYVTGHVGKWNLSREVTEAFDEARGVMDWKGHYFAAADGTFFGVDGAGGGQVNMAVEPHGWGPERPGAAYLTDTLTDYAIDFINRHGQRREDNAKPFFLYLAYNAVHSPWQAKKADEAKYAHLGNEPLRLYAAMLASLDDNIGRVLRQLKERGLEENTLVALVSDNGPALGTAQIKGWKPEWPKEVLMGSAGPLRGRKGQYYEGGIREPFILRWPGRLEAGVEYRRPVSTMDLYPTFCAAAGVPVPDGTRLDGVNLLPYLEGVKSGSPHESLYWLSNEQGAVRRGDWKLVISPWQPRLQLFNLAEDVGETRDLSAERPEIRDALLAAWSEWREPFPPRANPVSRKKPAPPAAATSAANALGLLMVCPMAVLSAATQGLPWADVDGVGIPVPPPEHPRLYLRAEHVAELPARLKDPVLQPVVKRLEAMARRTPQGRVEWESLQYLVAPSPAEGRETVERALALLRRTELADRQDACRETGRMMVTGAIVYDWLYPLLTADDKQAFIAELVRLAKTQECGYPPTRQGSVTGHSSEAMIMRDMISAGIAIYDEFPEMYRLAAGRFFREHLPARNWLYNGHAYHQGDSYGTHRYSWDTYPLWIFDRLGAGNVYNPEQRFVPYLWVYTTRPDGQRLRAGDTFKTSTPRGRPWSEFVGTLFAASYYGDGTLLAQFLRQGGAGDNETIFEFLWRDVELEPKPLEKLSLSRYFGSPFGWMVARTGWDQNAVIAEMKVSEYNFVNHQHLDAGAFQIYYQGALAIDSGSYSGSSGKYGSPHCQNYYWRTIAHNSLLVYDPQEDFGRRGYGNDGGQRLPGGRSEVRTLEVLLDPAKGYRTGDVLAHGFGPDPQAPEFTLLQGDITDAYSDKVRQVTRSFVFLNLRDAQVPAALVVCDRVVSADPGFRKYWLLHTQEEPRINEASAQVDCTQHDQRGRLTLDVLLPAGDNRQLESVGGPGKEYWVFGTNYANDIEPRQLERSSLEPGAWRIEISPKAAAAEDLFLTVMQVTNRTAPGRLPVRLVALPDRVGSFIERPDGNRLVLFDRDAQRSSKPVTIEVPGPGTTGVLVTDLAPGVWRVRRSGEAASRDLRVSQELGAAWFEPSPGTWHLEISTP